MKNSEYGWVFVLVIAILLLLPAARFLYFGGSNPDPVYATGPIRTNAYIDASLPDGTAASSDLASEVLADGIVTADEYQRAVDAYLACVTDPGYEIRTASAPYLPGLFQYEIQPGASFSTPVPDSVYANLPGIVSDCAIGTTAKIELIYSSQVSNPENADVFELTLACLIANNVIRDNESVTTADLKYALTSEDGNLCLDLEDKRTMSCIENPAQNGINGNPLILPSPESTPST